VNEFLSDFDLIKRLQKGDVEAFDLIYGRYSGKLYLFCMKYIRSHEESEELIQSVFLKIWENHKNLIKESSFSSYLFTITYNDICKLFRNRDYQKRFIDEVLYTRSPGSSAVEEGIDYQSVLDQVQKIVDKLPEKQRMVFDKSRKEGKSTKEIAKELNLTPGTVDNYISDSLKNSFRGFRTSNGRFFISSIN
jgi:RNA polymerase sigma-70 factor (family 1)